MATVQQSIEIQVPAHVVYSRLTQFEDYPRFMEEVEAVQQLDDSHLHWTTIMSNRTVEWDAEISEREPDRCIAWHNISGPANAGRVEVQEAGPNMSRVVFTLSAEPQQVPGSLANNSEEELAQRLRMDLASMKNFIEANREPDSSRSAPVATSSYAAGSEGWSGEEDPTAPVVSSTQGAAGQRNDAARSSLPQAAVASDTGTDSPQALRATQSDRTLSQSGERDEDGRFSVAEEVSLDQTSDMARHIGQMPQDSSADFHGSMPASDAMGKAMQNEKKEAKDDTALKPSMDRAVPPSE